MFEKFVDVFPSLLQTVSKIHKFLCFCWFLPQKNRLFPTRCYSAGQVEVQSPVGKPVMDQEVRTTSSAKAGKVGWDRFVDGRSPLTRTKIGKVLWFRFHFIFTGET